MTDIVERLRTTLPTDLRIEPGDACALMGEAADEIERLQKIEESIPQMTQELAVLTMRSCREQEDRDAARWRFVRDHVIRLHATDSRYGNAYHFIAVSFIGNSPEDAIDRWREECAKKND